MPLKQSEAWGIDHLSRNPISSLTKEVLSNARSESPWCSFVLFPHTLSLDTREKDDHVPLDFPSSPNLVLCLALLHPKCRVQYLDLLNSIPLTIAQSSNLSRSFCKASCLK